MWRTFQKKNDAICTDPPLKLEVTYTREDIKGSHPTPFCDPMANIRRILI